MSLKLLFGEVLPAGSTFIASVATELSGVFNKVCKKWLKRDVLAEKQ